MYTFNSMNTKQKESKAHSINLLETLKDIFRCCIIRLMHKYYSVVIMRDEKNIINFNERFIRSYLTWEQL